MESPDIRVSIDLSKGCQRLDAGNSEVSTSHGLKGLETPSSTISMAQGFPTRVATLDCFFKTSIGPTNSISLLKLLRQVQMNDSMRSTATLERFRGRENQRERVVTVKE